jgi:hypothetical protein
MDIPSTHPVETFDSLLRDLITWGLVVRQEETTGVHWQLVPSAQQRLDELEPSLQLAGVDVYLNRRCVGCNRRTLTRRHDENYVCEACWAERQGRAQVTTLVPEPSSAA